MKHYAAAQYYTKLFFSNRSDKMSCFSLLNYAVKFSYKFKKGYSADFGVNNTVN